MLYARISRQDAAATYLPLSKKLVVMTDQLINNNLFSTPSLVMITGFINPFLSKYIVVLQVTLELESFSVSGLR